MKKQFYLRVKIVSGHWFFIAKEQPEDGNGAAVTNKEETAMTFGKNTEVLAYGKFLLRENLITAFISQFMYVKA